MAFGAPLAIADRPSNAARWPLWEWVTTELADDRLYGRARTYYPRYEDTALAGRRPRARQRPPTRGHPRPARQLAVQRLLRRQPDLGVRRPVRPPHPRPLVRHRQRPGLLRGCASAVVYSSESAAKRTKPLHVSRLEALADASQPKQPMTAAPAKRAKRAPLQHKHLLRHSTAWLAFQACSELSEERPPTRCTASHKSK